MISRPGESPGFNNFKWLHQALGMVGGVLNYGNLGLATLPDDVRPLYSLTPEVGTHVKQTFQIAQDSRPPLSSLFTRKTCLTPRSRMT